MKSEPVITVGAITAVVAAALALAAAFGLNLTREQAEAILGFIAVAGPLVAAVLSRRKVTPTAPAEDHYADTIGDDGLV